MKQSLLLAIILMIVVFIVPATSTAQESSLSNEELELLDRVINIPSDLAAFETYGVTRVDNASTSFIFMLESGDLDFSESTIRVAEGYEINGDQRQAYQTVSLSYTEIAPNDIVNYRIDADVVIVGDQLSVRAEYNEATDDALPLQDDWVTISDVDDIPEAYEELSLDSILDGDYGNVLTFTDLLETYATEVTSQVVLVDGEDGMISVERIIVTISQENLPIYLLAVAEEELKDGEPMNPLLEALYANEDTEIVFDLAFDFDEQGNPYGYEGRFRLRNDKLDASLLVGDQLPEGTLMSFEGFSLIAYRFSDFDAEFDSVELPTE